MATTTKLIASSSMPGPEILSLNKMEQRKYQLRVTKEMIEFINKYGFSPLVDKTKIMNVAMKLLPNNDKELDALEFFLKAKRQSLKKSRKAGFRYLDLISKTNSSPNYAVIPVSKCGEPLTYKHNPDDYGEEIESDVAKQLNIKKKATSNEVAS